MDDGTPMSSDDEAVASTFERALADVAAAPSVELGERPLAPGTLIDGCYRIERRLGVGGMGVVYLAQDVDLDRSVAIKFTQRGASETRAPRMWREAKTMARFTHPNVIPVYEVGTFRGMFFIAMEYLDGGTADEWVHAQPRTWTEILDLYLQAGRGLAAAHGVGVVHRDFKPDNVLVGADGRVRVADFGLAHSGADSGMISAESSGSGADSGSGRLTRTGAALGTPAYMAPEQWESPSVDARADQFSFCVALFEALYGRRPFGTTSRKLVHAAEAAKLDAPARTRVPPGVLRVLRRGLAPDPARRFPDMDALLTSLRRAARQRTRVRWTVGGLSVVTLSIAGVLGAQRLQEHRRIVACEESGSQIDGLWNDAAREAVRSGLLATGASHAQATADLVMPWLDAQAEAWRTAAREACVDTTVRERWSTDTLEQASWCLDDRRLELQALVTQLQSADDSTLTRAVQAAAALRSVDPCRDPALLARLPTPPDDVRDEVQAVRAEFSVVRALQATGDSKAGLEAARSALKHAESIGWSPLVAAASGWVGSQLGQTGAYDEAETVLETAFFGSAEVGATEDAFESAQGLVFHLGSRMARHADAERWWKHAELMRATLPDKAGLREAMSLEYLGTIRDSTGAYEEAIDLYERALQLREASLGPRHPKVAQSLLNLGLVYEHTGSFEEAQHAIDRARGIYEEALGPRHPHVGQCLHQLASLHYYKGEYDAAKALHVASRAIWTEVLGPRHPRLGSSFNNQANVHQQQGEYEEAARLHEEARSIWEETHGPRHPNVAASLTNLANTYRSMGRFEDAVTLHQQARSIYEEALGPRHPDYARALSNLASVYHETGKYEEATKLYEEVLSIRREVLPPDHPDTAEAMGNLAGCRRAMGAYEEAAKLDEEALAMTRKALGAEHPYVATRLSSLAHAHLDMKHHDQAMQLQQEALAIWKKALGEEHPDVALALNNLANMELATGSVDEARRHYERALAIWEKTLGPDHVDTGKARRGLAAVAARAR